MALTTKQRNKLPDSAFKGPGRSFPVPTAAQAAKAGISEASRKKTANAAVSYAAKGKKAGTTAPSTAGKIQSAAKKVQKQTAKKGK